MKIGSISNSDQFGFSHLKKPKDEPEAVMFPSILVPLTPPPVAPEASSGTDRLRASLAGFEVNRVGDLRPTAGTSTDLEKQLSRYAHMNVAELVRASYLEERDLTEDDLKSLPSEMRDAIEREITSRLKEASLDATRNR